MANRSITLFTLADFPLVQPGDDLPALIAASLAANQVSLEAGDIVVIAQKVVSKAENCFRDLAQITPSAEAETLAAKADKDPRMIEAILAESNAVIRVVPGVVIVESRLGLVHANAGIDQSNVRHDQMAEPILLLPEDPDRAAGAVRDHLLGGLANLGVVISDSVGRAWRNGTTGLAIGSAGLEALRDLRGENDLFGRVLEVTEIGFADEVASAASLLMGQADEAAPVVILRGLDYPASEQGVGPLLRDKTKDLFR
jgi:coenzyme F420-0:L-glutamate ligase/coenzyme F420-1:gamma-L-glutamate ligase